jgi:putative acetyltransferase
VTVIRHERPEDEAAIHALTESAFGRPTEADLNDRLRSHGKAAFSLVADSRREVLGHVMFAPVRLEPYVPDLRGLSLGPIAVLPAFQGRGIGRRLIETGLTEARHRGHDFVMLLGSPKLYPRFGFAPGIEFGLRSNFDVPDDEFMMIELRRGVLKGVEGTAYFAPEFAEAESHSL